MKNSVFIALLAFCVGVFSSCMQSKSISTVRYEDGNRQQERNVRTSASEQGAYSDELYTKDKKKNNNPDPQTDARKVIYNASLTLVSKKPDSTAAQLLRLAESHEGYAQFIGTERATLRIKATELETVLKEIAGLGKVKNKTVTGNDVTEQYTDFEIRLTNAEVVLKRYLDLLAKAVTVTEILAIEKELERVRGEIELYKGKLKFYDNQVDYATINIYIQKKIKPGVLGYIGMGLYYPIKWLFVRN